MTKRQQEILEAIVKEYVKSSKPVSSKNLAEYFEISSATIRNEMKELEKKSYLQKPHTSAGRVPSEKAYRLFIKSLEDTAVSKGPEDAFEKHFNYLFKQVGQEETKVFIGKEIPMVRMKKFTLIITNYKISEKKQETIGLISPTRMRYDYNISLINKLREMLEDYE